MRISITSLMAAAVFLAPAMVCAQAGDAAYCKALSEKYETYLANMSTGRSPQPDSVGGRVAMEQCKAGNTVAAIPILEQKLRSARIDLPPRG
jgi:hypothetical protein